MKTQKGNNRGYSGRYRWSQRVYPALGRQPVSPSERGNGLGKQLVSQATQALERKGIAKTHLFVANDNINAQQFYASMGWYPRDEVRMYSFNASGNQNV